MVICIQFERIMSQRNSEENIDIEEERVKEVEEMQQDREERDEEVEANIESQQNQEREELEIQQQGEQSNQQQDQAQQQQMEDEKDESKKEDENGGLQNDSQQSESKKCSQKQPQPGLIQQQNCSQQQPPQQQKQSQEQNEQLKPQLKSLISHRRQNSQACINYLENKLSQKDTHIDSLQRQLELVTNLMEKQKINNVHSSIELQRYKVEKDLLEGQKNSLEDEKNKLLKKIETCCKQLEKYKELGDIGILANKVDELETLVSVQKQELAIKTSTVQPVPTKITAEHLQKLEKLQQERQNLNLQVSELKNKLIDQENQLLESTKIMNQLDESIKEKMEKIDQQNDQILECREIAQKQSATRKQIENKMAKMMSDYEEVKNKEQTIEQIKNEKEILFREFKKLELQYENLQDFCTQYKQKYFQLKREKKILEMQSINKKQYNEVLRKYHRNRRSLERSIEESKFIQRQNQQILEIGGENISQEESQQKNKASNTINSLKAIQEHIQRSLPLLKESTKAISDHHMQKQKTELEKKTNVIKKLEQKIKYLEQCNDIYQGELNCKNYIIDKLKVNYEEMKKQNQKNRKEKESLSKMGLENIKLKGKSTRTQNNLLGLLAQRRELEHEIANWKKMYHQIKAKYEQFIDKKQNMQIEDRQDEQKEENIEQISADIKATKGFVQRQKCKQLSDAQIQTDTVQLYYKQLKQTLQILKKFPVKIKSVQESLEEEKGKLQEAKKKYDTVVEKYNLKFRQIKNEKSENDIWRTKTRQQIQKEFYEFYNQFSDLMENERLITCLRKSKNLIQELENAQGGQQEEVENQ